jgi:xylan 1,4-beta-xylosidase
LSLKQALLVIGGIVASCGIPRGDAQTPRVQVLNSHWVALRFAPEYPHGRHTQNPLASDGLVLPAPEASFIKGQAGQGSENKADSADYRIPLPSFVVDAGRQRVVVLADLDLIAGAAPPVVDGVPSHLRAITDLDVPAHLSIPQNKLAQMKAFDSGVLTTVVNPAEVTVAIAVKSGQAAHLHGARGAAGQEPVLLVETMDEMKQAVGWSSMEQSGLEPPKIAPLFDQFLRDTSIVLAPDGMYYMTGTTGGPEMMVVTSDLSVWKSPDLWNWSPVRDKPRQSTVVWNIDRDGTWMKPITLRDGEPFRPLWAPEIHYMRGTFWIPFSVPRHGVTLLKSTSGKAEGPYEIAIKPDEPLSQGIDASLFQDDDGTVYFLYGGGWIARMKPDMSGIAEPFRHIASASGREVGFEGVYLFKHEGLYTLCVADFVLGEYNTYIATAKSLSGPWSERYLAVPHAGHANFFRDKQGRMWSTFFGNDRHSPFSAKPGIIPLTQDRQGRWRPDGTFEQPSNAAIKSSPTSIQTSGAIGPSDGQPQQTGIMPVKK